MLNIDELWHKSSNTKHEFSDDEIKFLLDNRLWFVTDRLDTVSKNSEKETLFDLIMLVIDSLSEHRQGILNMADNLNISSNLLCHSQSQILREINIWHNSLGLHWNTGKHLQNVLFFGVLTYAINIWLDDNSIDSSKVMAKIDELISWMMELKNNPLQIIRKFGF